MTTPQVVRLPVPAGTLVVGHRCAFAHAGDGIEALSMEEAHRYLVTTLANPSNFEATRRFWGANQFGPMRMEVTNPQRLAEAVAQMCESGTLIGYFVPRRPSDRHSARARAQKAVEVRMRGAASGRTAGIPPPTKFGARGPGVQSLSIEERILEVIKRTPAELPPAVRVEFVRLCDIRDPSMLTMVVSTCIVWVSSHSFGVGLLIDAVLFGTRLAFAGHEAIDAAKKMHRFLEITQTAQSAEELDDAAEHLARAITGLGARAFLSTLQRGMTHTVGPPPAPTTSRPRPPPPEPPPSRFLTRGPR